MDVHDLLGQAWSAVKKSGVPEPLQSLALKEAIDFLRSDAATEGPADTRGRELGGTPKAKSSARPKSSGGGASTFFAQLAHESGEEEKDLRDVLQLTADSSVHVTAPTKNLGQNLAEQARTVIALVAGARSAGLGEDPVDADAVRREAERKRCYQQSNFASGHLRPLKGFNAGSKRNEIVLTSKWIDEFHAAVAKAHGRDASSGEG